jgi:hypothetical protein
MISFGTFLGIPVPLCGLESGRAFKGRLTGFLKVGLASPSRIQGLRSTIVRLSVSLLRGVITVFPFVRTPEDPKVDSLQCIEALARLLFCYSWVV